MADPRPSHFTYPKSLMNIPTEPFPGAANAIYGKRGPQQAANTGRQRKPLSDPPESLDHHIQDAIAKIPDLSGKQKLALHNTLRAMCRDISFIHLISQQAQQQGPHSSVAAGLPPADEGRPL
jgi:hypothetical protein